MTRAEIKTLQRHLNQSGYGPLVEDGIYGPATQAAHDWYLKGIVKVGPVVTPPAAKPWWTSRALLGALATIGLSVGGIFIDVSNVGAEELTNVLVSMSTGIAGLLALYGTLTRKAPIDPTLAAPGVRWGAHRSRANDGERVQPEPLPPNIDGEARSAELRWTDIDPHRDPGNRNPSGFPRGPFFDP